MKVVLACGFFDLLHVGHVRYLKDARDMGDRLVVGVNRDRSCNKGAGRPVIPEMERLEIIASLDFVDDADLCDDAMDALMTWNPNVFSKGGDYLEKGLLKEEIDYCNKHRITIRFTKVYPQRTTRIIEKIRTSVV